jgi:hypothetical protein
MFRRQGTSSTPLSSGVKRNIGTAKMAGSRTSARPAHIPKKWHAISLDIKPLSCTAAHDLRKRRFLSKDAPALPLEACTKRASCPCKYRHHEDRRGKPRRGGETGISSNAKKHTSERRISRGRRIDD